MRQNLTKKEIINSIYMQLGFSKNLIENILEDIFEILLETLKEKGKVKVSNFGIFTFLFLISSSKIIVKKSSNIFSQIFLEKPSCI